MVCDLPTCPSHCIEGSNWANTTACSPYIGLDWPSGGIRCGAGNGRWDLVRLGDRPAIPDWQDPTRVMQPCRPNTSTVSCDLVPCPVDCVEGSEIIDLDYDMTRNRRRSFGIECRPKFNDTLNRTVDCGAGMGQSIKKRLGDVKERWGGKPCAPEQWHQACDLKPCAVNCVPGTEWDTSPCVPKPGKVCGDGAGRRTWTRLGDLPEQNGGKKCSNPVSYTACNLHRCPSVAELFNATIT